MNLADLLTDRVLVVPALLLLAYAVTGTVDYHVAQGIAEEQAEQQAELRQNNFAPVNDPINPPRCPSVNAAGEPLRYAIAVQADGGEWSHSCRFGIET